MPDDSPQNRRRSRTTNVVAVVLVLLVAYPLSLGPVFWLFNHGLLGSHVTAIRPSSLKREWKLGSHDSLVVTAIEYFYLPLEMLYERFELIQKFFDWYFGLWSR